MSKNQKSGGPVAVVKVGNVGVKIYREAKKTGYASFRVADHSQGRRRMLTFSTIDLAKDAAERIGREIASGTAKAFDMSPKDRAAYGRALQNLGGSNGAIDPIEIATHRYAESVRILGDGSRLIEAVKFFAARNPSALPRKTVSELAQELIATKEARHKSARYIGDLRARLGRFAGAFACNLSEITTPQVQGWLDGLKLSPQSYINFRRVVYSLFAFAEARGFILKGSNPVEGVETVEAAEGDIEIYSPVEFGKLLAAASPAFLPCVAIGGFAGIRSAEIERLEWSNIDLAERFLTVSAGKAKTASRRVVPMSDALAQWLAPFAGAHGLIWRGGHDEFYDAQQTTAQAAGVKWKANGLRHSYASYRLAQIGDDARVSLELGNSRSVVHRHYKEVVRPRDAEAWFSIKPEAPANVVAMVAGA